MALRGEANHGANRADAREHAEQLGEGVGGGSGGSHYYVSVVKRRDPRVSHVSRATTRQKTQSSARPKPNPRPTKPNLNLVLLSSYLVRGARTQTLSYYFAILFQTL